MAPNNEKPTTSKGQNESEKDVKQETAEKALKDEIEKADEANENDPQAMFNVYLFDSLSKTSQMEKFVSIGSYKNVKSATLAEVRKSLISENALSWRQKSSKFCNGEGAEVDDKMPFDLYLNFLKSSEEKPVDNDENRSKKAKANNGQPITRDLDSGKSYKVYLKLRRLPTEVDETTRDFLKKELDLQITKPELASAQVNKLASSYNHKDFMALAAKTVVHPADMGEREWYIVLQNNSILHGNYVRQLPKSTKRVERAMYPAFALKPRMFHDFEVVFNRDDTGEKRGTAQSSTDDNEVHHLRIPRFQVQDDSYIDVSENKSEVADAIAGSSLSEHAAEVSVGGGAFGVSAGVKVGYKMDDSNKTAENKTKDTKRMTITYNFPRVVLELDGSSLDLSDECKKDLEAISTAEGVHFFRRKYGTFFATRVELGGRLHSSESSESYGEAKVEEKARSLKISAAASFSSTYAQGSASGSYGTASNSSENHQKSTFNNSLSWEAKGGDTLLCNNPPAWCGTVASFYNWRISKQDDLLSIEDMISLIPEYESTKRKFDSLVPPTDVGGVAAGVDNNVDPVPNDWDGWVTFWLKHPNESLYPTVVEADEMTMWKNGLTPRQADAFKHFIRNYTSSYCFQMMEDDTKDHSTQVFQAGCKFFEVYDQKTKTVKYRFKPGHKYILMNNKVKMYLGATPPVPGGTQRSIVNTAGWDDCAYFQFTHAFESDKMYISNRDLVRVNIFDSSNNLIGPLKNLPPLGSYGVTSGDIFTFRYQGEP